MRLITKTLTLGSLLLSSQLLGPLAMASTELPGEGVRVQPLQSSLPEESFQALLVSTLFMALSVTLFRHAGLLTGGTAGLAACPSPLANGC